MRKDASGVILLVLLIGISSLLIMSSNNSNTVNGNNIINNGTNHIFILTKHVLENGIKNYSNNQSTSNIINLNSISNVISTNSYTNYTSPSFSIFVGVDSHIRNYMYNNNYEFLLAVTFTINFGTLFGSATGILYFGVPNEPEYYTFIMGSNLPFIANLTMLNIYCTFYGSSNTIASEIIPTNNTYFPENNFTYNYINAINPQNNSTYLMVNYFWNLRDNSVYANNYLYKVTFFYNRKFNFTLQNFVDYNVTSVIIYLSNGSYSYTFSVNNTTTSAVLNVNGNSVSVNLANAYLYGNTNVYLYIYLTLSFILLIAILKMSKGFLATYSMVSVSIIYMGYNLQLPYFNITIVVSILTLLIGIFVYMVVLNEN